MIALRPIRPEEAAWFASLGGGDVSEALTEAWEAGSSSPQWTLVAEIDGEPLARGALYAEPVGGGVDTLEGTAAFLWADYEDPRHPEAMTLLLDGLADRLRPSGPTTLDRRLNSEVHTDIDRLRPLLESAGFDLLQEKLGFTWVPSNPAPSTPARLRFRSLAEVGHTPYRDIMAATASGTLDRNDRYYQELCGPRPWADEMLTLLQPGDERSWLIGYGPDDTPVGFVAVGAFDDAGTWTIVHIGVVPAARGHGHVDDLLAVADRVARERGFTSGLSDLDTENAPMIAAMERAGHRTGQRPWHVWHYRRAVGDEGSLVGGMSRRFSPRT